MSLVYITYHKENIFNLDKDHSDNKTHKRLKYISKFRPMIQNEKQMRHVIDMPDKKLLTSSARNDRQTMGYAETPKDPPCNFLKKNNGIKWQRLNEHKCPPKRGIPPIPPFEKIRCANVAHVEPPQAKEEKAMCPHNYLKAHKHRDNFIAKNVNIIKNLTAHKPEPRYVDTPKGEVHRLLKSGLVPQYVLDKNFAKIPCYIAKRKRMMKKWERECQNAIIESQNACPRGLDEMSGLRKMTLDERNEILKGLKTNFSELFTQYQKLSLNTDTLPKKLHKNKIEKQLRDLEQDMYLMESNPVIYVSEY